MLKWIEATGRTEDAAVQSALAQLGLDRDSVSVEVLERAKSGFLGFGSAPAKVKVTYEVPDEAAPAPQPEPVKTKPAPKSAPKAEQKAAPQEPKEAAVPASAPVPAPPAAEEAEAPAAEEAPAETKPADAKNADVEDRIRAFLSGLLAQMEVQAEIVLSPRTENGILVTLEGQKLGALIGHRGETLDAIQQLTNYSVNRGRAHRVRVHIDAEN